LHLVSDAYSKQIMGYTLSKDLKAESTVKALQMAILLPKTVREVYSRGKRIDSEAGSVA
jgi:hypothetical protein